MFRNALNDTLSLNKIIEGVDITSHYLSAENKKFKIFRYNNNVYAVCYDNLRPIDYVHMWNSHKNDISISKSDQKKFLGSGVHGDVYTKTQDKAVKQTRKSDLASVLETNIAILEQKFLLKKHDLEKFFVLGLWNVKDKNKIVFYMPKVNAGKPQDYAQQFDEFILGLKKLNELGYAHPDLANNHMHNSPQNMMITAEGIKTIDIDSGFFPYLKDKYYYAAGKDQWIYVYNQSKHGGWRSELDSWYKNNKEKALSDDPYALLHFYNKGIIVLPKTLANNMLERMRETALDYISKNLKARNQESKGIKEMVGIMGMPLGLEEKLRNLQKVAIKRLNRFYMKGTQKFSLFSKKRDPDNQKLYELLRDMDINNPNVDKMKAFIELGAKKDNLYPEIKPAPYKKDRG